MLACFVNQLFGDGKNIFIACKLFFLYCIKFNDKVAGGVVLKNDNRTIFIDYSCNTGKVLVGFSNGDKIFCIYIHVRDLLS